MRIFKLHRNENFSYGRSIHSPYEKTISNIHKIGLRMQISRLVESLLLFAVVKVDNGTAATFANTTERRQQNAVTPYPTTATSTS